MLRLLPGIVETGPLGDPDIISTCFSEASRTVGADVEAQPIVGDGRVLISKRCVNERPKVDRVGPLRELAETMLTTTVMPALICVCGTA